MVLYAASDAVDTDFVAKLVDVYPDGSSYNMAEGIVRARYRESLTQAAAADAGPGVSVRDRSGGHFGRVSERAPHPRARDEQPFPAVRSQPEHGRDLRHDEPRSRWREQTVYHDAERASHILLPVIPSRPR